MSHLKKFMNHFTTGIFVLLMLLSSQVSATHIVGADMTFSCNGKDWYSINLTVRRDCLNGDPEAVFDDPAFVGIFDGIGTPQPWLGELGNVRMELIGIEDIDVLDATCTPGGAPVCVSEATYVGQVFLPVIDNGYVLAYQRCCRNATLTNILNPLETGNTSFVCLTKETLVSCNNSPVFGEFPEVIICNDQPLVFDASATDADGDELRYSLFTPHAGGSLANPQPIPPAGPDYDEVIYAPGFSLDNVLGGDSNLSIDPVTGILTAQPGIIGQFLVGILVEEFRGGVSLSKTRRNFEYNVRDCSMLTGVGFDAPELICEGFTVDFQNTSSSDVTSFSWNFNSPTSDAAFMSTEANPSFTFPGPGTFTVVLTTDDDVCRTETSRVIRIVDSGLTSGFDATGLVCDGDVINISVASLAQEPNSSFQIASVTYEVIIGDQVFVFNNGETVLTVPCTSSLTIRHTVVSTSGCDSSSELFFGNIGPGDSDDSDGDGVSDEDEMNDGTDPNDPCDFNPDSITLPQSEPFLSADCDGDGVTNGDEIADGTDPLDPCNFNPDSITLPQSGPFLSVDCDGDGVTNGNELEDGTDPFNPCDFILESATVNPLPAFLAADCDGDGVTNGDEIRDGTDPLNPCDFMVSSVSIAPSGDFLLADCDGDGVTNGDEIRDGTDPLNPCDFMVSSVSIAPSGDFLLADCDGDGVTNGDEIRDGTDPSDPCNFQPSSVSVERSEPFLIVDCDGDGVTNGDEIQDGTDPFNPCDFSPTSITLEQTDNFFNANCDSMPSIVFIGDPIIICEGNSTRLVMNPNPNFTYTWTPTTGLDFSDGGMADPIARPTTTTTYTVDVSDGQTTIREMVTVEVINTLLNVGITNNNTSACNPVANLSAVDLGNTGVALNYDWSFDPNFTTLAAQGQNVMIDLPAGTSSTIYLRAGGADFCGSNVPTITLNASGIATSAQVSPINTCFDSNGSVSITGDPGAVVVWDPSDNITSDLNAQTVDVTALEGQEDFTLSYTVTTSDGCTTTNTVNVGVEMSLDLGINASPVSCDGIGNFQASANGPIENVNIEWSLDENFDSIISTNPMLELNEPAGTAVFLRGSTESCQSDVVSSVLADGAAEFMLSTDLPTDQRSCEGDSTVSLNVTSNGGNIEWFDQDGNMIAAGESITVDRGDITSATAIVVDQNGCPDSIVFDVGLFEFDLTIDGFDPDANDPICMPSVNLNVTDNSGSSSIIYEWISANGGVLSGGDTPSPTIDVVLGDDLVLVVTNEEFGCMDTIPFPVMGAPGITAEIEADPGTTITEGESVTLTATTDAVGGTFVWSTGETTQTITVMPEETTTYTVVVTDENGCTAEDSITITVEESECSTFDLPNAFTPNGDGNNDELLVRSDGDLDAIDFQVLDRWGREVFRTTDITETWNGRHQQTGSEISPGVFAYCLQVTCNGVDMVQHGSIALIR